MDFADLDPVVWVDGIDELVDLVILLLRCGSSSLSRFRRESYVGTTAVVGNIGLSNAFVSAHL